MDQLIAPIKARLADPLRPMESPGREKGHSTFRHPPPTPSVAPPNPATAIGGVVNINGGGGQRGILNGHGPADTL